jgi:uncharacterized protein YjdB
MSPEQCMARELSGASDQYSLGVVAYEMLTGHAPFAGSPFEVMQAHTAAPPPSIRDQRPDCPPELEAAVLRLLAKDPEERFADVAEAIDALGGYLPGPQDPIRSDLVRLVESGSAAALPGREPLKPTPPRLSRAVPSAAAPPVTPPPPRVRGRLAAWGAGAVAIAAAVTWLVVFQGGASQQGDPPVAPIEAAAVGSIDFASEREEVLVGSTLTVRAGLQDAQGTTLSDRAVEWSSSDPAVATASGTREEVVIRGLAPGSATILARAGTAERTLEVDVVAPAAGELSLSAAAREVTVGSEVALSGVLTDASGARVADAEVAWRSASPDVLEVDPRSGLGVARAPGSARVTATAGEQSADITIRVVGRVDVVTVAEPPSPLRAGQSAVLRSTVVARPAGYRGRDGVRWSTSDPGVAVVAASGGDSAVIALTGAGEAALTASAGGITGAVTLRVQAAAAPVALALSTASVAFAAVEGGDDPAAHNVGVSVAGDAAPSLGVVRYDAGAGGWLTPSLGATPSGETMLTLRASMRGLGAGIYAATVPVSAGDQTRGVEVRLSVGAAPETAVEPGEAAAAAIAGLLATYTNAINSRDVGGVRRAFPSVPQAAVDELLRIRESDTYYLQLQAGSLRPGDDEGTLDGEVLSGVLGQDNRGELVRMIYTFGRGDAGWFIVALRPG